MRPQVPTDQHHADATGSAQDEPLITVRDVRKRFGGNEVLRGVDIDIDPHEVLVIIGPSGSGKTTFLRALNALERVDRGTIVIEGRRLVVTQSDGRVRYAGKEQIRQI